jgi:hypothetical protein
MRGIMRYLEGCDPLARITDCGVLRFDPFT